MAPRKTLFIITHTELLKTRQDGAKPETLRRLIAERTRERDSLISCSISTNSTGNHHDGSWCVASTDMGLELVIGAWLEIQPSEHRLSLAIAQETYATYCFFY